MVTIIRLVTIIFFLLAIVERVHTNWLLTNSRQLRNESEKARTPKEKSKAYQKLLTFTEIHLKVSTISSIFALVLDYSRNHRPK